MLTGCAREKKELPKEELLVGFSQLGSESGWRLSNTDSITAAAEKAGVHLMMNNANQSQEKQIKALRSFIAYQVDVIAFSPIVEDGWDSVLREAKESGIPVIVEDRMVNVKDESLYATHIGSDFYDEGVRAGKYLLKKLEHLGPDVSLRVVELAGTTDSSPTLGRAAGFRDTIAGEERITILDSIDGDFLISRGTECMATLLDRYQNEIDVVYIHNDAMMYGALQSIENHGLVPGKDVIIISVDGEQRAIDLLKAGKVNCVVECTPMLGEAIMQIARDLKDGKQVEREIYSEERAFTEFDDLSQLAPRGY
jgi:simple sugar transport system substrate-binding protein